MRNFLKVFVSFLFLICCVISVNAQKYQDVVYLKNGSVVHGVIVEQIPNQTIKIKTSDNNTFVYDTNSINRIIKEQTKSKAYYKGFVDAGLSLNTDDTDCKKLFIETSHGCQLNDYFFMGAGIAYNQYIMDGYDTCDKYLIPVFVDLRINFLNKKVTPFFDVKFGYSFGDYEGFYFNPSVGCHFKGNKKCGFNITISYDYQKINNDYGINVHFDGIGFKMGIDF